MSGDSKKTRRNGAVSVTASSRVQVWARHRGPSGAAAEEPAIVTLGSHLDGIRRLSRQGQARYWVKDVVADILG